MENYLNNFQSFVSLEYLTELRVSTPINPIFPDFAITIFVFRAVISHVVILCFKCSRSLQLFVTSIVCFVVFISLFLLGIDDLGKLVRSLFSFTFDSFSVTFVTLLQVCQILSLLHEFQVTKLAISYVWTSLCAVRRVRWACWHGREPQTRGRGHHQRSPSFLQKIQRSQTGVVYISIKLFRLFVYGYASPQTKGLQFPLVYSE